MNEVIETSKGYQDSKLGVIPQEWRIRTLLELSIDGCKNGLYKSKDCYGTGIDMVHMGDVFGKDIIFSGLKEKVAISDKELENFGLQEGDLLFARRSLDPEGVGKTALIGNLSFPMTFESSVIRIRPDQQSLNPYYALQYLKSYKGRGQMMTFARIVAVSGITGSDLLKYKIPLPPLPEQKKIAAILSTWDQAIAATQKLIDELKLRNKGLAQQLLTGKKRLKGFDGEWIEVTLKDIAERVTRKNEELDDTVVTISAQRGFVLQEDFFTKRVASETLSNYYLIHNGEFAYNKSYSKGYPMGAFKRLDDFEKAVVTTLYICFSLKENVNSDFMKHFFEGGLMIRPLMKIAQEGGRAHGLLNIGIHDFFGLKLTVPQLVEQEAINSVLSEADEELKLHQKKLETLKEQKKGLMQKLLTGEIRVKTD